MSAVDLKALIESHPRHTTVGDEYVSVLHSELSALTHTAVIAVEALREVAADDDERDGCSHADPAKDALAQIAALVTIEGDAK